MLWMQRIRCQAASTVATVARASSDPNLDWALRWRECRR
jgi:hypothetical protein